MEMCKLIIIVIKFIKFRTSRDVLKSSNHVIYFGFVYGKVSVKTDSGGREPFRRPLRTLLTDVRHATSAIPFSIDFCQCSFCFMCGSLHVSPSQYHGSADSTLVLFRPGLAWKPRLWLGFRWLRPPQTSGLAKAVNHGSAPARLGSSPGFIYILLPSLLRCSNNIWHLFALASNHSYSKIHSIIVIIFNQ